MKLFVSVTDSKKKIKQNTIFKFQISEPWAKVLPILNFLVLFILNHISMNVTWSPLISIPSVALVLSFLTPSTPNKTYGCETYGTMIS